MTKLWTPKFLGQFHTVLSNVSQSLNHQNRKPTGRDISPRYARHGKLRYNCGTQAYHGHCGVTVTPKFDFKI